MIGTGMYVLTGTVTRDVAGPSIIVSFLVASSVALLAALCFAEFASRVPRCGSTYVYSYITLGELPAFVVGWNMVLEQLIGTAAAARAWSGYVDSLARGAIHNATSGSLSGSGSHHAEWADQLDFLAAGVVILVTLLQAIGARCSTNICSLFSLVNVAVILFVSTYGLWFASLSNWNDFTPYGVSGLLSGASSCFFAFAGLDSMAIAAEEAKDPGYSVPRATFYALGIVTFGYVALSVALTLMVPFNLVSVRAALTAAFAFHNVSWAQYLLSVLSLSGLGGVLFAHMYSLPRYMCTMASDGLVFRFFGRVSNRNQVPVLNTFLLGGVAAFLALSMDIARLVDYLAMGTLVGYSMVALAVLHLRYRATLLNSDGTETTDCIGGELKESCHFLEPFIARLPYGAVPTSAIYAFTAASFLLSYLVAHTSDSASAAGVIVILLLSIVLACCLATLLAFEQTVPHSFAVPFCPMVPLLAIWLNMLLLTFLRPSTFLGFFIWMLLGLLTYFSYGLRHSTVDEAWRVRPLSETDSVPQWYGTGPPGTTPNPSGLSAPPVPEYPPSTPEFRPGTLEYCPETPDSQRYPLEGKHSRGDSRYSQFSTGKQWDTSSLGSTQSRMDIGIDDSLPRAGDDKWRVPPRSRTPSPSAESWRLPSSSVLPNPTPSPLPTLSPSPIPSPNPSPIPSPIPSPNPSPKPTRSQRAAQSGAETPDIRRKESDVRPELRRQSVTDTESLPSLQYDEMYRTAY
ncbi:Cationic amino acid transporter 4 [Amphibalanus amphitrite]|uniref:Cationic amino acid transporter 4 n=1 Tax=Amphibalanus amphitrite TaxID=1232801 RepID=A0A6A4V766_AMPAM|nr:Cationic amino acid transporter 4 [Amphibalanus amphitrite]